MSTQSVPAHENAATRPALTATDVGLLILRLGLGIVFVAHGSQKVLGLFGGHGLAGTVQFMGSIGIPAPLAYLACFTEFLGGLGVLGGLLARLSGLGLAIVMSVAILQVHASKGFFAPAGFEYPMALLAMALAVMVMGPGRIAIADLEGKLLARRRSQ